MERSPVNPVPDSPSRVRALLKSNAFRAGIVVVSAAIIFGAWVFADYVRDDSDNADQITLLLEDDLYEQAREAAESGETTAAIALLERVLAEDPDHEQATALLTRLRAEQAAQADSNGGAGGTGETTSPDDGSTGSGGQTGQSPGDETPPGDAPRDDSQYLAPANDLRALLPDVITGWRRGTRVADDTDATVPFEPATAGTISRVIYSVHDRGSAQRAVEFVENTSKTVFATDGSSVRVGVVDGYFGTDGNRLATIAFARGQFAFEVVAVTPDGVTASVKDALIDLAREFEATR